MSSEEQGSDDAPDWGGAVINALHDADDTEEDEEGINIVSQSGLAAAGGDPGELPNVVLIRQAVEAVKAKVITPEQFVEGVKKLDAVADNAHTDVCSEKAITDGWMGLDIGAETIKMFSMVVKRSKTILWNGPMGVFEMKSFQKGTIAVANAVADATAYGAFSLVGGGDSVAAVNQFGLADKISYVSTGGGAMLEYLEGKVLPGIKAVQG